MSAEEKTNRTTMSNKINPDAPAFPIQEMGVAYQGKEKWVSTGMSMREYYAGLAMQGLVVQQASVDRIINEANKSLTKQIAEASVIIADALINELNK